MKKLLDIKNLKFDMEYSRRSERGFTLIELLVVIAIIGILATFMMANFIGVKGRARDAQRKSDIKQIQAALEFYRSDTGKYPVSEAWVTSSGGGSWIPLLTTQYMSNIPKDPTNSGGVAWDGPSNYTYSYWSGSAYGNTSGTVYLLVARLENEADKDAGKTVFVGTGCPNWPTCQGKSPTGLYTAQNP
ncbi:hypothetical protein BH11PAT1_BH11PAT1_3160 [soil metagenome]